MSEQDKQESQKTVVAFVAGLLIGGLLVWVFGGTPQDKNKNNKEEATEAASTVVEEIPAPKVEVTKVKETKTKPTTKAELPVGNGSVKVPDQKAGASVSLDGATFPSDEGWIGVRDYVNGQLTGLLGVVRYSKTQGLVPETIVLQRTTVPGNTYAVVFYSENGDRVFNLAEDVQVGGVMETFTAQ